MNPFDSSLLCPRSRGRPSRQDGTLTTFDRRGSRMSAGSGIDGVLRVPARLALAICLLALVACRDDGDESCCFVEIRPAGEDRIIGIAPPGAGIPFDPGDTLVWYGSLTDSAGLAGMEIDVLDHALRAGDFPGPTTFDGQQVRVGRSRTLYVLFRLRDKEQIVARGGLGWALRPDYNWILRITRGPQSGPCPEDWWCDKVERLQIAPRSANYPGEPVWLMLTGGEPPWNGTDRGDVW